MLLKLHALQTNKLKKTWETTKKNKNKIMLKLHVLQTDKLKKTWETTNKK